MLLFRSEEHVDRWLAQRRLERGCVFALEQCWELAEAWYRDKLEAGWRRRTPDEAQAVFEAAGLTGDFWRLTPS